MSEISLRAQSGRAPGSRESRRIRRQGQVPAVVYGKGVKDPIPVAVDAHDLHVWQERVRRRGARAGTSSSAAAWRADTTGPCCREAMGRRAPY